MENIQEAIAKIDSSLVFRRRFGASSMGVYEVEKAGSVYVLKVSGKNYLWGIQHIEQERQLLSRAKKISGITHLVHDYGNTIYGKAILKEYFEGTNLYYLSTRVRNKKLQEKLENTVKEIHSLGFGKLDLNEVNTVLSPDFQDVCLIDLGYAVSFENFPSSRIEEIKFFDLDALKLFVFG
ncbi:serine/threonine protein kinase [Candidatus Pacearchaeota archaeon]|nr:serine/threonine protein kinase [Candidatus Pacearchaeota archaeon]